MHDSTGSNSKLSCKPIDPDAQQLKRRDNVPEEVYVPGDLEHPAIANLMLSRDQRLFAGHLVLVLEDASTRAETPEEKRFRLLWRKPIPVTPTRTMHQFTKMDLSLFKQ